MIVQNGSCRRGNNYSCECISQRCDDYEGNVKANNEIRYIAQQNQNECYCVSQRCDDKENWCYCISQKQEVEKHNCSGGSCTCKKEETQKEDVTEQVEETPKVKKSLWEKIKDIFD